MTISRTWFFIVLFIVLVCPFLLVRLAWMANSGAATGTKYFTGHGNLGSVLGISTYPVIRFTIGTDTFDFNGNVNIHLEDGQKVPIRYRRNDPADARIDTFTGMWADVIIYSGGPLLVYLGLLFTPGLIPSSFRIRKAGFKKNRIH